MVQNSRLIPPPPRLYSLLVCLIYQEKLHEILIFTPPQGRLFSPAPLASSSFQYSFFFFCPKVSLQVSLLQIFKTILVSNLFLLFNFFLLFMILSLFDLSYSLWIFCSAIFKKSSLLLILKVSIEISSGVSFLSIVQSTNKHSSFCQSRPLLISRIYVLFFLNVSVCLHYIPILACYLVYPLEPLAH